MAIIIKTLKIVKVISNDRLSNFPNNLVTRVAKKMDYAVIFSEHNIGWMYPNPYIKVIDATPREQFLFYVNNEKPFVLEE